MKPQILLPTTAGIDPGNFSDALFFSKGRVLVVILVVLMLTGFTLRVYDLGAESLGEDEFNKLQTVEEYRTNGLSGKNGEHPFLMKGLQTVSISAAEKINSTHASPDLHFSEEGALRFPIALFGTLSILLIFLLVSELFGASIGLVSAALYAVEPTTVGFDRIAKEDSLVLFFFLLTSFFFVKSQTKAEQGNPNWIRYVWGAAAGYGALMASKYYPFFLSIIGGYYNTFLNLPNKKWDVGGQRWIKFFVVMGVTFLILNPTIMLPDTWREMLKFSSENRIGHDSYEFMGSLYQHKVTDWLGGVPWTFYYVFIAVKTSAITLAFFLVGLPVMFKRKLGDGRFFILLWAFLWFMPFTVLGGKFTRYFTFAAPLILIIAAVGFCYLLNWITEKITANSQLIPVLQLAVLVSFVAIPLINSLSAAPHFRMFTNSIGGGMSAAGTFFPHDEFYDTSTREIIATIAPLAAPNTLVACETPSLFGHYASESGKENLIFVSLSDNSKVITLKAGDFIVITRGRRYFSNAAYQTYLEDHVSPVAEISVAGATSALVFRLDAESLAAIQTIAKIPYS